MRARIKMDVAKTDGRPFECLEPHRRNIRVFIIDNNQRVRRQLTQALMREQDFQLVGDMPADYEAVQKVLELRPDLIILEIKTGDDRGLTICRELSQKAPEVAILVLTSYIDEAERINAFIAGANSCLLKDFPSKTLVQKIRRLPHAKTNVN